MRHLEQRVRDLEEAIKLLALEQRHAREAETAEREKFLLRVERELARPKALPPSGGRKRKS